MLEDILAAVIVFMISVVLAVAFGALLALPVMLLWNGVLPNLLAENIVKPINFWNAWGLLILCGLLFRSSCPSTSSTK